MVSKREARRQEKLRAQEREARQQNQRDRVRAYRERHKEELKQMRRITLALMGLRTKHNWSWHVKRALDKAADRLLGFLTPEEAKALITAMTARMKPAPK